MFDVVVAWSNGSPSWFVRPGKRGAARLRLVPSTDRRPCDLHAGSARHRGGGSKAASLVPRSARPVVKRFFEQIFALASELGRWTRTTPRLPATRCNYFREPMGSPTDNSIPKIRLRTKFLYFPALISAFSYRDTPQVSRCRSERLQSRWPLDG